MKESAVQNHIRLMAAQLGYDLWRNNLGQAWMGHETKLTDGSILLKNPRPVRFGLANDSSKLNKTIKSSDLIGLTPIFITPEMVGRMVGVFTAVEVKDGDWRFNPCDNRALAQKNFHDIVRKAGGYAGFAQSTDDYKRIIGHET